MLPERPQLGYFPCPTCGRDVDAIRAPRVVWLEDGPRFLCGDRCRERFSMGERAFDTRPSAPTPAPSAPRPSIPDLVREATHASESPAPSARRRVTTRRVDSLVALGLAALALAFVGLSETSAVRWLGGLLIVACAAMNARTPLSVIRASPPLQWMAPLGLALATAAALFDPPSGGERSATLGCAAAALLLSVRNLFHTWANAAVEREGRGLEATLPAWARIPTADGSSYEEVSADVLQPGDVAVVLEGERLPADAVVEEGDGTTLLYPRAPRASEARPGDFLLAGTQVVEGALTVRARRARRDRTLSRLLDLRQQPSLGSSGIAGAQRALGRWGWAPLTVLAFACGATVGLGSAGTLLLGLPALALIASFDAPLESAALAASARGMYFGGRAAVLDAGRVRTTAILLRGALTAGDPLVQQAQSLGNADLDYALSMAAATERVAQEHPIARAILRYADERELPLPTVRKERVHPGLGVTAVSAGGGSVVVGRRQLLLNEGISVATGDDEAKHIENEGLTPIFIAVDGNLEVLLTVLDPTHVGAADAVRRISELPSEVVIVSGDDRRTVERIAEQLGASRVKAPLLPGERALEVRALHETGGITAAVGRGGADDAVLAAADVPVSLRLAGTATEQRGIVAAGRDIRDAAGALWIARAARRSTARALGTSAAVLVLVTVGAWLDWMTPPLAAAIGIATEVWALRAGSRLIRRVDLRVPMRQ